MLFSQSVIEAVLNEALAGGADFAEIFVERSLNESLQLSDSKPKSIGSSTVFGVGLRVISDLQEYYVSVANPTQEQLIERARELAQLTDKKKNGSELSPLRPLEGTLKDSSWALAREKEFAKMRAWDKLAREKYPDLVQLDLNFTLRHQQVQIANSEGIHRFGERHYRRVGAQAIAESAGVKEAAHQAQGRTQDPEFFEAFDGALLAEEVAASASRLAKASPAPGGEFPVVIDNAFGGVIFHEACGHGLETTSVAQNASVFCDRLGSRVANECVTAVDDGTLPGYWGSLEFDDEGRDTEKTVLIENGILKSYLVDTLGGLKTGYRPTGSGRRQDYRFSPASRMRNTFIAPGKTSFEDLFKGIETGIYAKKMGGGSVDPGTGAYNFKVAEGYMIRNGEIAEAVKGAILIGTGIETLGRITAVGDNFELAPGTCGSVSGWIPTTVGQPALRVSQLTVGGKIG